MSVYTLYLTTNMPSPGCFFMMLSGTSSIGITWPGHHLHTHTQTHTLITLPGNQQKNVIKNSPRHTLPVGKLIANLAVFVGHSVWGRRE